MPVLSPAKSKLELRKERRRNRSCRILNPFPGGSDYTSAKRAAHWIAIGQAVAAGPRAIRMILNPERARAELRVEQRLAWIRMGLNPDDVTAGGIARLPGIAGLPCIQPIKLIRDGRERFIPRAPSCGRVRHLV